MYGDPFSFIYYSVLRMLNYSCYTMVLRGFTYFGNYMVGDGLDYSGARYMMSDPYRSGGVMLLAIVIGVVLAVAMMKKVRLYVLVPFMALCIYPILTFNITSGKVGFAFIIAFSAACISLFVYDYRFAGGLSAHQRKLQKKLDAKEKKRAEKEARALEKQKLREEADKMLLCALSADMGRKKSKLARKAVFKAAKRQKKEAARAEKLARKMAKKQAKLDKNTAKAERKKLAALAKKGDEAALGSVAKAKEEKKLRRAEKKAAKAEKKAQRKKAMHESYRISAAGGYAGACTGIVALIAIILPVLIMTREFPAIPGLYDSIENVNLYVSAYLSGSEVDLNSEEIYGANNLAPRTLTFEPLEFEEASMFIVSSTSDANIYLKSWSATGYDYQRATWNGATVDDIIKYRDRFGADFDPASLGTAIKRYVYPSTAYVTEPKVYENFSKYGFNMQSVTVERLSGTSRVLFIPSQLNTDHGLLEVGTLSPADITATPYFDGIYSTRFHGKSSIYSTVSFIPVMNRSDLALAMKDAADYFNGAASLVEELYVGESEKSPDEIVYEFETMLSDEGITYLGTSIIDRFYNEMSDEEKAEFISVYTKQNEYYQYAKETYLGTTGSEDITALAAEIEALAREKYGSSPEEHELMLTLIGYLSDNYEYTLTPDKALHDGKKNTLDAFLFDVKEGYCTHFATAACQIAREWGIPARYCEGYIATDLYPSFRGFSSEVRDSNAHAWIELYIYGIGWVQYEVTPPYVEAMYDPDNATQIEIDDDDDDDNTPNSPDEPQFKEPEKDYAPDELAGAPDEITEVQIFITAIVCAAVAVVLFLVGRFLIKLFIKRGTNMLFERYRLIDRAKDEAVFKDPKADKRKIARSLDDQIIAIFAAIGAGPEKGELSRDYGKRISENYGNLSNINAAEVFDIIQKEEFGGGLDFAEMCTLAEYLADITVSVYAGLSFPQKIILRYIKRII